VPDHESAVAIGHTHFVSGSAYGWDMEEFKQEVPTEWQDLPSQPAGAFSLLEYQVHKALFEQRLRLLYPEKDDRPVETLPSFHPDFFLSGPSSKDQDSASPGQEAIAPPNSAEDNGPTEAGSHTPEGLEQRNPSTPAEPTAGTEEAATSSRELAIIAKPPVGHTPSRSTDTNRSSSTGGSDQPSSAGETDQPSSAGEPDQPSHSSQDLEAIAEAPPPVDWRDVWEEAEPAALAVLLADVDVCSLSDADTLDFLAAAGKVTAWGQSMRVKGLARFAHHRKDDGTGVTGSNGYSRFTVGEIAPHIHQSKGTLSRELSEAVQLWNWLPRTMAALEAGIIDLPRATAIAYGTHGLPDNVLSAYEEKVLPGAEHILKESVQDRVRRAREELHPESLTVRHERQMEGRGVSFFPQDDGMAELYIRTSADRALLIYNRLQAHAKNLKTADETRTMAQLRADVLAALLLETPEHAYQPEGATTAEGTGGNEACGSCGRGPGLMSVGGNITASVAVTIPLATAAGISYEPGHLAGYGPIPPETARNLAALAKTWLPVLIDEGGEAVAVAKEMRHPPEWLKRMVRLRDETCRGPGCIIHSKHCEIDHTIAWEDGGKTELTNLAPYCKPDHISKHNGGWRTTQEEDGVLRHQGKSGHAYTSYPDGTWIRHGVQPPPEPPPDPFIESTPPPF